MTTNHPNWQPITITRIHADLYHVGAVSIQRRVTNDGEEWMALAPGSSRPLFRAFDLEKILDMAHGACEMMRPVDV